MNNLDFENEMLKELVADDGLLIAARGIGVEKLLCQLIKLTAEHDTLILVLGTTVAEEKLVIRMLEDENFPKNRLPKQIAFDVSSNERSTIYASGGTLFITSRILVVDMLVNRVPIKDIAGIIIYDAHMILSDHQAKFILRLYRQSNKNGFIKALTQSPYPFIKGFGQLDRTMRALFVKKLYLWPRFRKEVTDSLNSKALPDVIEVRFQMSALMEKIQFALIDLISMCLKEMNKSSLASFCGADELTVEQALSSNFGSFLRKKFDPVWNELSKPTKRLITDIRLLRQLLYSLTEDDCVTFYNLIETIKQNVRNDASISDWLFWRPADILFQGAKARIDLNKSSEKTSSSEVSQETNPKWNSFYEIVNEIRSESKNEDGSNILVVVREDNTGKRLKEVISKGPDILLEELYLSSKVAKNELSQEAANHMAKMNDSMNITANLAAFREIQEQINLERHKITYHSVVDDDYIRLEEELRHLKPEYIIIYDPDMEVIRRIELYQANYVSPKRVKVYFFMFDASAEEQRYLTSLRREKEAFEFLIKEKATMVVPEERDGKSGYHPDLERGSNEVIPAEQSTRQGGITRNQVIAQTIIVDMREFRSELPSLIHKRGIDVIPMTIDIGDYVLTPDMCVERKSISDLIGSLNSGRLYTQCQYMTRHYKWPLLLIEFDEDKQFNLKGKAMGFNYRRQTSATAEVMDSMPKLVLLTLHFHQLRLIWSPSPHFSAEIFENLKQSKEQPTVESIQSVSQEQLPIERNPDRYDLRTREFLLSLPGVSVINVHRIMNKLMNILELIEQSEQQLIKLLDNERAGRVLYQALHGNLTSALEKDVIKSLPHNKRFKRKK